MKTFSFGLLSTPKLEKVVEGLNQTSGMDNHTNTIQQLFPRKVTFADIEVLEPLHNDNVEQIEPSQLPAGSLCEQREMRVQECDEPLNDDPSSLPQEELTIQRCASLVELLDGEGLYDEETHSVLHFDSKHLVLEDQPELKQLFGDKVLYPGLDKLNLCQNLKSLTVRHCGSLRNLFYPSMVRALVHLETLNIEYCNMLEEIVAKGVEEEEEEEERMDEIVIPQLKRLELYHLPNLISFCQGPYDFDLPSLVDVYVSDCPTLNTFSSGFVSTPKLEEVHEDQLFEMQLTNKQSFWMGDLNNTIQQLALPKKELTKEGDALAS
ncbi:hypothetical protein L1049_000809 [Liquidambar formosana]|uniref:Disease resistance protein At4g27190-like leucine-rich repeats domain-containing protein n=1 Tax=Liquidambar formosana TaxID=63359 RepID=A0AAP0R7Z4_LIQFO